MQAALPITHVQKRKTFLANQILLCMGESWFRYVSAYSRTKIFIEAIAGSGKTMRLGWCSSFAI